MGIEGKLSEDHMAVNLRITPKPPKEGFPPLITALRNNQPVRAKSSLEDLG